MKILLKTFNRKAVRFVRFFNELNFNFVYNWELSYFFGQTERRSTDGTEMEGDGGGENRCRTVFQQFSFIAHFPRTRARVRQFNFFPTFVSLTGK